MSEPAPSVEPSAPGRPEIEKLLEATHKFKASDLHLKAGAPPILRIAGVPTPLKVPPLTAEGVKKLVFEMLTLEQGQVLERTGDLDFAYFLSDGRRFRVNLFRDRMTYAMAARRINMSIPTFKDLYLPEKAMTRIAQLEEGIVLLAGVTGSGKSTTIASLVDFINERGRYHIITVEDPIEYVFQDKKSFINQREIGTDTIDFKAAIKALMRQDPDIIVAGEMRDAETFEFGLTAAETGHLVFGTLHAANVPQCFGRIIDLFPPERHGQIRTGLHFNLKAIICQKLLPCIKPGIPRVPAVEVMIANPIIRELIANNEIPKVADVVRNAEAEGMQDFTQALCKLIQTGYVEEKVGMEAAPNPEALRMALQGFQMKGGIL